jgi:hypothetical protein
MNQAVFEKFLVDFDGSTQATPTDMFGILLRQDFVLVTGEAHNDLVDGGASVHRNADRANGRPVNLGKGAFDEQIRTPERSGSRACLRHLQKVGLNKTLKMGSTPFGGGSGIRTHGALRHNGFRDRPIRPLSHPSKRTG